VIAQGVDPRGLRLRLIDRARGRGKILVGQATEAVSNFAINLDSQPKPFAASGRGAGARAAQGARVRFEAVVDGEKGIGCAWSIERRRGGRPPVESCVTGLSACLARPSGMTPSPAI